MQKFRGEVTSLYNNFQQPYHELKVMGDAWPWLL